MTTLVDPQRLIRFGSEVLASLDVPAADAGLVADSLVTADLWGHPSHGVLRLPWYAARLRSGAVRARTRPVLVTDSGAIAVLDGRDGIGQVVADLATRDAVDRAQTHGVGVVAVRNSNHFGTAAYWTRRMADRGCVGILTTNGSPAMAPWGGTRKTVGANPWSVATPGGQHPPVVLDIANTGVARGKIYAAAQRGERIPDTWAFDEHGVPTTDPEVAVHGLLAPMAGHKGYGISFVMDVLSGVLTGSGYGTDVAGPYVPDLPSRCGHLVLALRIDALMPDEEFAARVDDLIVRTKAVPTAPDVAEILYPGEPEVRAERDGATAGVRLPDRAVSELSELGTSCGVPFEDTVLTGAV
ncbi:Ldh family oxidoreductase [Streptomyces sp. NPDC058665]|uniref:Ldh family oxidoreductase n=1 Tax=Streptomyces sp. NPDC058665 TaxID=3346586 RepID=UPI003647EE19